ncbi:bifunctional phosphopantothenoylcysteine decarboxylase/phosphopantothenate--cysteine ligase CoaBC [Borrelia hermsii]|nr:bifunctional phosphopantothenoylcysteine decarboxylase/phosphopantothenate--cysteine ligase CoaBC [Borrelia hermsii]AJW73589.1 phosphopantothenoylcysteine decarboxylase [Borrelia hermsii CC1]AMR75057.1 Phosphopantothenoylcysteine decarboxylase / Phosphopantothenate--cysteine ligase [Borrelia hermsii]ANA43612.1 phosphopantothenoylcysteine decarboxylase [Borrelia hermsii HS1]UCP01805.1 bifunctional phosphopantothenoylcysteine decarboxylase/phosphopantothenate--cysteine ligase CoaBC [Borrelia h
MKKHKNILIGICGGIAAYKSACIVSSLIKMGYNVKVIMTENATKFITPLTLETVSKNRVIKSLWNTTHEEVEHINLARWANLILIIPATYNIISKIASGIADDALSTIISASTAPTYFAIAMNNIMYQNPILKENIEKLKKYNYKFIEPDEGFLACSLNAIGRLKNENDILKIILNALAPKLPLKNKKILITASRTEEALDPIRYLSNKSTGQMGFNLGIEAQNLGADVTIITGPSNEKKPYGINIIKIKTAAEMYKEAISIYQEFDIIIGAAAVADFRPDKTYKTKIKKNTMEELHIKFIKNPDIIKHIGKNKTKNQVVIGFCAQKDEILIEKAKEKLKTKNLDYIIANDLKYLGSSLNKIYIINKDSVKELPEMSKKETATEILKILYQ